MTERADEKNDAFACFHHPTVLFGKKATLLYDIIMIEDVVGEKQHRRRVVCRKCRVVVLKEIFDT